MNVLESWIRVADYNVPVLGGQAVCLYAQPGDSELIITSRYPYDLKSKDDEACKSQTLKLHLSGSASAQCHDLVHDIATCELDMRSARSA